MAKQLSLFQWHSSRTKLRRLLKGCETHWNNPRVALGLLLVFAAIAFYALLTLPSIGVSIALLGAVAALMTTRTEMKFPEKVGYIVVVTILLIAEVGAIKRSDESAKRDRADQIEQFKSLRDRTQSILRETESSLEQNRQQFQVLKKQSAEISDQTVQSAEIAKEAIKNVTGADSFCYFQPTFISESSIGVGLVSAGKYPLYEVSIRITDAKYTRMTKDVGSSDLLSTKIGDISPPGSFRSLPSSVGFKIPGDRQELNIFFSGKNGWWTQLWRLQRINGQWESASIVTGALDQHRYPKGAILEKRVTNGYPAEMLAKDQDWAGIVKAKLPEAKH
jgi:hypothetical protein